MTFPSVFSTFFFSWVSGGVFVTFLLGDASLDIVFVGGDLTPCRKEKINNTFFKLHWIFKRKDKGFFFKCVEY